jgi:hypothetical protein
MLGAAASVERWQLLSPVHALLHGTDSLNRTIQARYRTRGGENGTLLVTEDGPDGSIDSAEIERRIRQVLGL